MRVRCGTMTGHCRDELALGDTSGGCQPGSARSFARIAALAVICLLFALCLPRLAGAAWQEDDSPGYASREQSGGPAILALSRSARVLAVGLSRETAVDLVDLDTGERLQRVALTGVPVAVALDASASTLYAAVRGSSALHVIDLASGEARQRTLSARPLSFALLQTEGAAPELAIALNDKRVVVMDAASGRLRRSTLLPEAAKQILPVQDGHYLVATLTGGKVVTLERRTLKSLRTTNLGADTGMIAWWQGGGMLIAASRHAESWYRFAPVGDEALLTRVLPVDGDLASLSEAGERGWVASSADRMLVPFDLKDGNVPGGGLRLPDHPGGLVFDEVAQQLIVSSPIDDRLWRIDPAAARMLALPELRWRFRDLAVNDATQEVVAVSEKNGGTLMRMRLTTGARTVLPLNFRSRLVAVDAGRNQAILASHTPETALRFVALGKRMSLLSDVVPLPAPARVMTVEPARGIAVVLTDVEGQVLLVDTQARRAITELHAGVALQGAVLDTARGYAYLLAGGHTVIPLDLGTLSLEAARRLPVDGDAIGYDPVADVFVLAELRGNRAHLIKAGSLELLDSVELPPHPGPLAVNERTGMIAIASRESNRISMLDVGGGEDGPSADLPSPIALSIARNLNKILALSAEVDDIRFIDLAFPRPRLIELQPASATVGGSGQTVRVTGSGFLVESELRVAGNALPSAVLDRGTMETVLPASLLAQAGSLQFEVLNPSPGGGTSNPLSFLVLGRPATLYRLEPASLEANTGPATVSLFGSGFSPSDLVRVEGRVVVTAFVDASRLDASVPAEMLALPRMLPVEVVSARGDRSNTVYLSVIEPPIALSIAPVEGRVGDTVTLTGAGFDALNPAANLISFGGAPAVGASSATKETLVVAVPASALTGAVSVTVGNRKLGGASFTVLREQDFGLTASPAQPELLAGSSTVLALGLSDAGESSFTGLAQLSLSGLPAGVSARFESTALSKGQSGRVELRADSHAAPGSYQVVFTATGLVSGLTQSRSAKVVLKVSASSGQTGVRGRFVDLDGKPVPNVIVRHEQLQVQADAAGSFQLTGLPAGVVTLRIDSTPAHPLNPIWPVNVTLEAGKILEHADWVVNSQPPAEQFKPLAQAAATDQDLTDERYPGLKITIPAGAQIIGWDGVPKSRMAVERITPDKLPVPPPPVAIKEAYQLYFGTPMGGIPTQPIPVTLPNVAEAEPGQKSEIWYFDGSPMGGSGEWKLAGLGTVSADGKTVSTDPGFGIPRFCGVCGLVCQGIKAFDALVKPFRQGGASGAALPGTEVGAPESTASPVAPPAPGGTCAGKPVDLFSGQEMPRLGGISCSGRTPVQMGMAYNPVDAFNNLGGTAASLGYGWVLEHDAVFLPFEGPQKRLILPPGQFIDFTDRGDGTYGNALDPRFAGAVLAPASDGADWEIKFKGGRVWRFHPYGGTVAGRPVIRGTALFLDAVTDPDGTALTITRRSDGRLLSAGSTTRRIEASYGSNGFISELRDPLGRVQRFTYNASDRIETVTDAGGGVHRYEYLPQRDEASLAAEFGPEFGASRPTSDVTSRCPSGGGDVIRSIATPGYAAPTVNHYGASRRVLRQVLRNGVEYRFAYRVVGGYAKRYDQPGSWCTPGTGTCPREDSWENHEAGWRFCGGTVVEAAVTAADGSRVSTTFNAQGESLGGRDAFGQAIALKRDAGNRVTGATDPLGRSSSTSYDSEGNPIRSVDALGRITRYTWNTKWNKPATVTRTSPAGRDLVTLFEYHASTGKLSSVRDPLGHVTRYAYDAQGQLASVTDALGQVSKFRYNAAGDLVETEDPLGNVARLTPDAAGRIAAVTDPLGHITASELNGLGQATRVTDALGGVTLMEYDDGQRLARIVNPLGHTVEAYAYDDQGRLSARTDGAGKAEIYAYDAQGRLATLTDRKSRTTSLTYDAAGRVTGISFPDAAQTRTYDAAGRTVRIEEGDAAVEYSYDTVDRLVREVQSTPAGSHAIEYEYDVLDRLVKRTVDGAVTTRYGWDDGGRLVSVASGGRSVGYAWDAAGRLTAKTLPNGASQNYQWDAAGRLLAIVYRNAGGTEIGRVAYGYDANGQRIHRESALSPLGPETPFTADYDSANRMTAIRFTASGKTCTLTHDDNGNLASKACGDDITTYTWDSRDRLVGIGGPGVTATFAYDPLGRRVNRTVNGTTTTYVYDGAQAIAETRGSTTAELLTGLAIDEAIGRYSTAQNRHFLTDALGSVLAELRDDGSVSTTRRYSPYGEPLVSGETSENGSTYTGREDDGTGLMFYRARYYDFSSKRFVRQDPIGVYAGLNFHTYVRGNPLMRRDPLGLSDDSDVGMIQCECKNMYGYSEPVASVTIEVTVNQAIDKARSIDSLSAVKDFASTLANSHEVSKSSLNAAVSGLGIEEKLLNLGSAYAQIKEIKDTGGVCKITLGPGKKVISEDNYFERMRGGK
jgi:RHS repeat-associated protein